LLFQQVSENLHHCSSVSAPLGVLAAIRGLPVPGNYAYSCNRYMANRHSVLQGFEMEKAL
jgi:hypothetical protein